VWHEIKLLRFISMLSIGSVTFALISQYVFDMQPCAWCVFQRLLYLIIGVGALLLTLRPRNRVFLSLGAAGIVATAIAGVISAVYQEKVAANTFSCAQTFADQLMTKSGLDAAVPWLFGIYASCMEARVKLMGIEYAWWSMLMFSLLSVLGLITLLKLRRQ
jgi:disulfide bond formation protein DsbB